MTPKPHATTAPMEPELVLPPEDPDVGADEGVGGGGPAQVPSYLHSLPRAHELDLSQVPQ